jgi:hypothetical protein
MYSENSAGERLKDRVGELVHALGRALSLCEPGQYSMPLPLLSGATIGEHTRHIIEFFQCLQAGIASGEIDYGKRERNRQLETDKEYAMATFLAIQQQLPLTERPCLLQNEAKSEWPELAVQSGYFRELVYTIEHAIHHMAIIKIGLKSLQIDADRDFGVAPSTIEYRSQCAS